MPACPWCSHVLQLAIPNIDPPPDSVRVTKPALLEPAWLSRLAETDNCPACRKEIKIRWYGGQMW